MADRRMLHKKVVESDAFYKLSEGAQAIYAHLTMHADDDGFVNNAQSIASRFKSGRSKLAELVKARYVLQFEDVYVIKHWRIGNSLKNDRAKPPMYPGIAAAIWIKPNRAYTDHPVEGCRTLLEVKNGIQMESKRNPDGIQVESQGGIHLESQQNRTEQNRTEENRTEPNRSRKEGFEGLWLAYPEQRRGSREEAEAAFRAEITSEEDAALAFKNLADWKKSEQWNKSDSCQYVPYLSNWLTRGIWRTSPPKIGPVWGASGELGEAELEAIRQTLARDPAW